MDESDFEQDYNEKGKKKFVITRGMLLLAILILIIVVIVVSLLIKKTKKDTKLTISDYKKLEERMVEETPIYLSQKGIILTNAQTRIDLSDLLIENGGGINPSKVKAAKKCIGYIIASKEDVEVYNPYIKCSDEYETKGYVKGDESDNKQKVTTIKDDEKPVIKLIGDKQINLFVGDTYNDPGATASDNIDGDITYKIKVSGNVDTKTEGTYVVTYEITDQANNKASEQRKIVVSKKSEQTSATTKAITTTTKKVTTTTKKTTIKTTSSNSMVPPIIVLYGSKVINLKVGQQYNDPGYSATDYNGNNITSRVNVSGNVNTNSSGTYILTYTVTDYYGNMAITTRTINVENKNIPVDHISVSPNALTLKVGKTSKLEVFISPTNATNKSVSWSSSNPSVVTVSADGTIIARSVGSASITVKATNGKTATSRIIVK